jgi:hypothetical protein
MVATTLGELEQAGIDQLPEAVAATPAIASFGGPWVPLSGATSTGMCLMPRDFVHVQLVPIWSSAPRLPGGVGHADVYAEPYLRGR